MSEPEQVVDFQPEVTPAPIEETPVPDTTTEDTVAPEETVIVRVAGPITFTGYTSSPTEDRPGIAVTAAGVDVPVSRVEALIAEAASYGVHLEALYPAVTEES